MSHSDESSIAGTLPKAVLKPDRRLSLVWIVPLLAVVLVGWLGFRAYQQRGVIITVQLPQGHGLKPGDEVRYKGITVGEVRNISPSLNLQSIIVTASLRAQADQLARAGSRFWIVRPQLRLTSVEGLETLIGPRFLAVLPGPVGTPPWRRFIGLAQPPMVETIDQGDLEVIVQSETRGSLTAGSSVTYRQIRIGTVLSIGLVSDGGGVEARLHIEKGYAPLIRERTRFWDAGGVSADVGLTGFALEIDSLEAALRGSIAMATPPERQAGDIVRTGHRFTLHDEPEKQWLDWKPMIAIGSSLLPPGAPMPMPLRTRIGWTKGWLFKKDVMRNGWMLQTDRGLLGPADLLVPGEKADPKSVVLEVAGVIVPLNSDPIWKRNGLALIDARVDRFEWLNSLLSHPEEPVDCIAIADPSSDPLPMTASRLSPDGDTWILDRAIPIDETWHGAVIVARESGLVVGMLLVEDDQMARIALLPKGGE